MGGVVLIVFSMLILLVPCLSRGCVVRFRPVVCVNELFLLLFLWRFIGLTILGGCTVEYPFEMLGKAITCVYFMSMLILPI